MSEAASYRQLIGRGLTSSQACYLGEQHLLVLNGRFKEQQKRIEYKDIQAVLIISTSVGKIWSFLFGLVGVFVVLGALVNFGKGSFVTLVVLSVLCWSVFGYLLYQQGTARLAVQTAVQRVFLESVRTLRQARRVDRMLADAVEGVQGRLTQEAYDRALYPKANPATGAGSGVSESEDAVTAS